MKAELLLRREDELGEGMLCLPGGQKIAWVDILGQRLMQADADGGNLTTKDFDTTIGAVLPSQDGRLVLVLCNRAVWFDPASGLQELIWSAENEEPAHNRFNDAAIDPQGNLWICSMDFDATAKTGTVYRIAPNGTATIIDRGYACLNGPTFSPDGTVAYVGDTMVGRIMAYDIDPTSGAVGPARTFVEFDRFNGLPDGMATDCEGNIWVCQVTAGRICRYSPDGTKIETVALPVPMITSCAFGGENLDKFYVTSARIIFDSADLAAYPDSGSLYRIDMAVRGLKPNLFGQGAQHG
jgi:xylono-1,5-lactonase